MDDTTVWVMIVCFAIFLLLASFAAGTNTVGSERQETIREMTCQSTMVKLDNTKANEQRNDNQENRDRRKQRQTGGTASENVAGIDEVATMRGIVSLPCSVVTTIYLYRQRLSSLQQHVTELHQHKFGVKTSAALPATPLTAASDSDSSGAGGGAGGPGAEQMLMAVLDLKANIRNSSPWCWGPGKWAWCCCGSGVSEQEMLRLLDFQIQILTAGREMNSPLDFGERLAKVEMDPRTKEWLINTVSAASPGYGSPSPYGGTPNSSQRSRQGPFRRYPNTNSARNLLLQQHMESEPSPLTSLEEDSDSDRGSVSGGVEGFVDPPLNSNNMSVGNTTMNGMTNSLLTAVDPSGQLILPPSQKLSQKNSATISRHGNGLATFSGYRSTNTNNSDSLNSPTNSSLQRRSLGNSGYFALRDESDSPGGGRHDERKLAEAGEADHEDNSTALPSSPHHISDEVMLGVDPLDSPPRRSRPIPTSMSAGNPPSSSVHNLHTKISSSNTNASNSTHSSTGTRHEEIETLVDIDIENPTRKNGSGVMGSTTTASTTTTTINASSAVAATTVTITTTTTNNPAAAVTLSRKHLTPSPRLGFEDEDDDHDESNGTYVTLSNHERSSPDSKTVGNSSNNNNNNNTGSSSSSNSNATSKANTVKPYFPNRTTAITATSLIKKALGHTGAVLSHSSLPNPSSSLDVKKLNKQFHLWPFDILAFADTCEQLPLTFVGVALLNEQRLLHILHIDKRIAWNCLTAIQNGYHMNNPFHNAIHGADVAQSMAYMLNHSALGQVLEPHERLAVIMASLCHDYDHPGFTNNYLITSSDEISMRYNDMSVLENHHASASLVMIKKSENNIFGTLSDQEQREVRSLFIQLVLSTDLANHFEIMAQFKRGQLTNKAAAAAAAAAAATAATTASTTTTAAPDVTVDEGDRRLSNSNSATSTSSCTSIGTGGGVYKEHRHSGSAVAPLVLQPSAPAIPAVDLTDASFRLVALKIAIKCADLNHFARPWHVHEQWVYRLMDEFYGQGEHERQQGFPVSPMMDRDRDRLTIPKNQISFLDFVVHPLWEVFHQTFPLLEPFGHLGTNRSRWEQLQKKAGLGESAFKIKK